MARKNGKSEVTESVPVTITEEVAMNTITETVEAVESVTTTEETGSQRGHECPPVVPSEEVAMKIIEDNQAEGSVVIESLNEGLDTLGTPEEVETINEPHPMIRTTFVMTPEEELTQEAWDDIQERLDVLNVESIKLVIDYCRDRLQELQRAEIEALEAEMRAIQQKLFSMKGVPTVSASMNSAPKTRTTKPIVNPNNPHEVYSFGRTPGWLSELMETTGKTIQQLRNGN